MKVNQYNFKQNNKKYFAVQYNGNNGNFLYNWSHKCVVESPICEPTKENPTGAYVQIRNNDFNHSSSIAIVGDWIVYDFEDNEYITCSNDFFEENYELINLEKEISYILLEWTVILDEYGDRSKIVAISNDKEQLIEHCLKTYNKLPDQTKKGYDNYFTIEPSKIICLK